MYGIIRMFKRINDESYVANEYNRPLIYAYGHIVNQLYVIFLYCTDFSDYALKDSENS